jgi:uncharacterized protein YjbI with pentapeptide repeats
LVLAGIGVLVALALLARLSPIQRTLWRSGRAIEPYASLENGLLLLGVLALLAIWVIPKWQVRRLLHERRLELELEARKLLAQMFGGVALLAGLYFTAETLRVSQHTLRLSEQGQITERFARSIQQLGDEKLPVRLGGIYALERLGRESAPDNGPVIEVLTAYVRHHAPLRKDGTDGRRDRSGVRRIPADVQGALTVLGRGTPMHEERQRGASFNLAEVDLSSANLSRANLQYADLTRANLRGADLSSTKLAGALLNGADLRGAQLVLANLERANLQGANLQGANLVRAWLQGTILTRADLRDVRFSGTKLWGAYLCESDLRGTDLGGADLQDANLEKADLRGADARTLTMTQIRSAITDRSTKLPEPPPPTR